MSRFKTLTLVVALMAVFAISAVQAQDETIVELAAGNADLSTLVTAVEAAGLVDVLSDPDAEWTVFAPTNKAFAALPDGALDALLADPELLTRVLTYHVVQGNVTSDQLTSMMAPSMEMTAPGADLMGSELEITVGDNNVMVNDANVIMPDVIASNGVVHVIDKVLIPSEIGAMLMGDMASSELFVTENPGELTSDRIAGLELDLSAPTLDFSGFSDIASIQSVKFASNGNAYVTYDIDENSGGVMVIDGLAGMDSMDMVGAGSNLITGTNAGIVAPKGIEVIEDLDLFLIANFGAANIKGFSLDAEGDATPLFVIDDFGDVGGSVWDIHYDADSDTLFAAGTTGTLFVYADFSNSMGMELTKTIVPSDENGVAISVNLHGVDYDASSDTLILTDVGSADDNTDGQIFTLANAMMAEGNVPVTARIAGANTMLGNPVDVIFDGSSIYVAEKANDLVLRYDNILDLTGTLDQAADVSTASTKPESLAFYTAM